jgi:hypothetical protein
MVLAPRHPGPTQLAADSSGRVLVASLGYEHPTYLDRLDPSAWAAASERIAARVIDGSLWVTEAHGEDNVNFCADPRTGTKRGQTIVLPGDSVFLTADRTSIYYTYVPGNAHAARVERAPISRACTA